MRYYRQRRSAHFPAPREMFGVPALVRIDVVRRRSTARTSCTEALGEEAIAASSVSGDYESWSKIEQTGVPDLDRLSNVASARNCDKHERAEVSILLLPGDCQAPQRKSIATSDGISDGENAKITDDAICPHCC